ncbi:GDSL-like Lipase/Acylhydrolase [Rubripirellula lacrimiformis]|uniref:GDSL-like Lipase/Acylhydrolase n=1 Tax=Rubripirellula lacrimiformis TaxID=1930273 RepID=A0A517N6A4_9BACT|nr:GDSL-type esterase/lipase family protein [Rubripirellula lacrimiformis]QDT02663.1 GDSL-like Lipase/Acylhydrolase [Rubripirellula lacrimiformis]
MRSRSGVLLVFAVSLILGSVRSHVAAQAPTFPFNAKRILFLGDSITYAGHYVDDIDAALRVNGYSPEIINLALPSETCSGLTEPDHPFPRPDVHTRIDRALAVIKPDLVVACYGMNDGIYHPLSDGRLDAYKNGIGGIIDKVAASGAKLILLSPPPFDPEPLRGSGKLVPVDAKEFGYKAVYEDYDHVMETYAGWLMDQSDRVAMVIDLRKPILDYVAGNRAVDPKFAMSSDGVHLNKEGHQVIADAVLDAWGLSQRETADASLLAQVAKQQSIMKAAWLSEVGHDRPGIKAGLPLDEARLKADAVQKSP